MASPRLIEEEVAAIRSWPIARREPGIDPEGGAVESVAGGCARPEYRALVHRVDVGTFARPIRRAGEGSFATAPV
jgi:hypothetical protein